MTNATRVCSTCRVDLPLYAYSKNARGAHGLRSQCRECRALAGRAYYQAWNQVNPGRYNETSRLRGRKVRLRAIAVHGGLCVQCGATEHLILDHIEGGGTAHRRVESHSRYYARIARTGIPDPRLQVLCEDCHKPKTAREQGTRTPYISTV